MKILERPLTISQNIRAKDVRTVYYLITVLNDLSVGFVSATYALFLLSKGLNVLQMNLVNTAFMIGNFVFEIPTGVYADFFGRKKSYIIHALLLSLSGLVYFLSSSFLFFILAELIAALSFTFASGAIDAWLVDNVTKDWVTRTDYIFNQGQVFSKTALIIGGVIGGYLGQINLGYPWLLVTLTGLIIVLVSILYMQDDKPVRSTFGLGSGLKQMVTIAKDSFHYGFKNKIFSWLMMATFISQLAFQPLNMFWAPRFNQMVGGQIKFMGWLWAGISTMMIVGSYLSRKLVEKKVDYWKIMVLSALFLTIPILISSFSSVFTIAIGAFLIYEIGRGIDRPMKTSYINKYIPSDKRATLISFDSMIGKLAAALGLVIFGFLADKTSFSASWVVSALLLLILIPVYLRVKKKEFLKVKTKPIDSNFLI
jgi:MFS family permease